MDKCNAAADNIYINISVSINSFVFIVRLDLVNLRTANKSILRHVCPFNSRLSQQRECCSAKLFA